MTITTDRKIDLCDVEDEVYHSLAAGLNLDGRKDRPESQRVPGIRGSYEWGTILLPGSFAGAGGRTSRDDYDQHHEPSRSANIDNALKHIHGLSIRIADRRRQAGESTPTPG